MLIFALSGLELPIGERADCGLSDRLLQRGLLQNLRLQQVTTSLQTTNKLKQQVNFTNNVHRILRITEERTSSANPLTINNSKVDSQMR